MADFVCCYTYFLDSNIKFKNPFRAHETNTMQGLWAKNEPIRPSRLGYRGKMELVLIFASVHLVFYSLLYMKLFKSKKQRNTHCRGKERNLHQRQKLHREAHTKYYENDNHGVYIFCGGKRAYLQFLCKNLHITINSIHAEELIYDFSNILVTKL